MNGDAHLVLALLQADENRWTALIWLLILVLPVLGRALRALLEKFGLSGEQQRGAAARRAEARRAEVDRDRGKEERHTEEAEGEDLWRRLLRGEEANAPPAPPPRVAPRLPGPEVASLEIDRGDEAGIPRPLSVLGEVEEPGEAAETSLESEAEPEPLAALAGTAAQPAPFVARKRLALRPSDLRQAVLFAEILGPPVALRPPSEPS